MRHVNEVEYMIRSGAILVNVNVLYSMPDHPALVNEFFWQTTDIAPSYPRVERFLAFWEKEIEGKIRKVSVSRSGHLVLPSWSTATFHTFSP